MDKLHIIFVFSNLSYPPREGLHLQSTALIRALRRQGHEISVIAHVRQADQIDGRAFSKWCEGLHDLEIIQTRLNYPLLLARHSTPGGGDALVRKIRSMADSFQQATVIHLEGIGLGPLLSRLTAYPCVMSTVDAWSLRQQRLAERTHGARRVLLQSYATLSARTERTYFPSAQVVHVVSEPDAEYLRNLGTNANIVTIPVALINTPAAREQPFHVMSPQRCPVVAFWGDIRVSYLRAGLEWLFDKVQPHLQQAGLNVEWRVYGRQAPDELLRARSGNARFFDWVDDIDSELRQADVIVLPDTSGSGLKNRVLHAMTCGVPVVGTSYAFEGFPIHNGREAFVQDDPSGFAQAMTKLLISPAESNRMAQLGRTFAVGNYGMDSLVTRWEHLYAGAIASHQHHDQALV